MNYNTAVSIIRKQLKSFSKLNNMRFAWKGYEYRLQCEGNWLAPTIGVYRRLFGKRNFKYFTLVDVSKCHEYNSALTAVYDELGIGFDENGKAYDKGGIA